MHFTSFETASLKRLELVELPDGTFIHKNYTFVVTCLAESFIDDKVITTFQMEHADLVYNFNTFPDLLQALQDIFKENA
jgi:hypothetical protein